MSSDAKSILGTIRGEAVKPVLNWANVSSRTYLEVFVKASLKMFSEHSPYSTIIASDWLIIRGDLYLEYCDLVQRVTSAER